MASAHLDGRIIADWPSFHRESRQKFGFPDFYGNNMDAWIDCLSSLREPDSGMTSFALASDEILRITVDHSAALRKKSPQLLTALEECTVVVFLCFVVLGVFLVLLLVFCFFVFAFSVS